MKQIEDEFKAFMSRCYPDVEVDSEQYKESRNVFWAASFNTTLILIDAAKQPHEKWESDVSNLRQQFELMKEELEFRAELKKQLRTDD